MKKITVFFVLLVGMTVVLPIMGCGHHNDRCQNEFVVGAYDSIFIDRVTDVYNKHVYRFVGDSLSLKETYEVFMLKLQEWVGENAVIPWTLLEPKIDQEYLNLWYDFITGELYTNIYHPRYAIGRTAGWYMQPQKEIYTLAKWVGIRNPFWEEIFESVSAAGDFVPTHIGQVIFSEGKIDFDDYFERFLTVCILMPREIVNESFTMKMHLEHNENMKETRFFTTSNEDYHYQYRPQID